MATGSWVLRRAGGRPAAACSVACLVLWAAAAGATTWTVNDTTDAVDANPGNGVCATAADTCTLRAAVMEANAYPGDDTIIVSAGTHHLTITAGNGAAGGDLDITEDLVLVGFGAANTVIDASAVGRAFLVQRSGSFLVSATLQNLAITGATSGALKVSSGDSAVLDGVELRGNSSGAGGGAYVEGDLTLDGAVIADNHATNNGGGVFVAVGGSLTVTGGSRFEGNTAGMHGGAIYADGGVSVYEGEFLHNAAGGSGGAICVTNLGGLSIAGNPARPLFAGNTADTTGGAVYSWTDGPGARLVRWADFVGNVSGGRSGGLDATGPHQVLGCSFRGNIAQGGGGGGASLDGGEVQDCEFSDNRSAGAGSAVDLGADATIENCTLHGNLTPAGGALYVGSGVTATARALTVTGNGGGGVFTQGSFLPSFSIVFGNQGGDCLGPGVVSSGGYNIDGDGSCGLTAGGDMPATDPLLGTLGPHGGPTRTRPVLRGSPGLDAIPFDTGMTTDQRGEARPADGDMDGQARQDIGAYELVIHPGDADGSGWYDAVDLAVEIALAADTQYPAEGDPDCTESGFFEPYLDIPCTVAAIW